MSGVNDAFEGNANTPGQYKEMLDRLPRLVMLIDLDGTIVYWNEGGKEVFGYSSEESIGNPVWFLYPERQEYDFNQDLDVLKKGGLVSEEMKGRHKNGSTVWVDVKRRIIQLEDGRDIILGSASDINVQKMAEHELAYNKKRLETILDTAVEGIITIDANGIIQSFNQAAKHIFSYEAEEVIGQNVNMLMPAPFSKNHDQYIQNYLETGERRIIGIGREVRGKRKDGSIFPMKLSVSEVQLDNDIIFTGFVRDISRRRQLENEILQASEEERQRIGRDLHDGLGQMLTGIGLISQNLVRKLEEEGSDYIEEAKEIYEMLRDADEQAKALAHGLVHIELEEGSFVNALRQLSNRAQKLFNINCELTLDIDSDIRDKMIKLHLYRIVQEAVSNAVKHGKANNVEILFEKREHHIRLIVKDDGYGFEEPVDLKDFEGIGVNTMYYRAHLLGGNFDIQESENGETLIICTFPSSILYSDV